MNGTDANLEIMGFVDILKKYSEWGIQINKNKPHICEVYFYLFVFL
ncbi:hypothetical protein Q5M85_17500 [Paraclostridium bifermentans]|nr:hypothetical protein [Paraclostridium bifermentans]